MALDLLEELANRGLLAQVSHNEELRDHLSSASRTVYCGFDPTAESLHIGNLVPLLTLRRFQENGHSPLILIGGATGLIGDPSGRSDERNLNSEGEVKAWVANIRDQAKCFLDFDGDNPALLVNNLDWTKNRDVISFLRDIGKHFSVNQMVQRDSVKSRLERDDEGISYTEFSYMLLQANDYAELAENYGCTVQIGGSDQWGNIVSGMDLVRRRTGIDAFAITMPLVTKADGTKFGKSAGGSIWLDPQLTSPYSFFQFWYNTADLDVEAYLKTFTFLELDEIARLVKMTIEKPEKRIAQRALAREITILVHGEEAADSSARISRCLFEGDVAGLVESDYEQLKLDGVGATRIELESIGLLDAIVSSGLATSRGAARKLVQGKGISLNGKIQSDLQVSLGQKNAAFGKYQLLRKGKKNWHLLFYDA